MPRVLFIRHAESVANIGGFTEDFASIPLTPLGIEQARELATRLTETPQLIVVSPFARAKQTAQFTIDQFSAVPVEEWPVEEFTYLRPERWEGTTWEQRWAAAREFWAVDDPEHCDGLECESFAGFLRRVEAMIKRLGSRDEAVIYVFTHGQVMHAVRVILEHPERSDHELRALFLENSKECPIGNCEFFAVNFE